MSRSQSFFALVATLMMTEVGCTRFDLLNATVPTWGYHRTRNLPYGPLPAHRLDVYLPCGATRPTGIVIFFYGGDWQTGKKEDYRFVAQALTSQGFIAVLPDYRLYPEVRFPDFVQDGALAVRWVYDHAAGLGGNGNHIFLMGHSAGAHIAALLTLNDRYLHAVGLDRSAIRATAALSGPYDFIPPVGDRGVFALRPDERKPAPSAQPITFADGHAAPMLLVHGLSDTTVEPGNATRLAEKIQAAGGQADTAFYSGKGHVAIVLSLATPFRWLAPTLQDVCRFFRMQSGL